ncbi:hypothetical protein [Nocardiopsis sp. NPDC006832]|uniref:hypothetical protein n=1 Tax=Nocardiopsis sp. NPDC006832 TaxID=3157188 RepID=UPI0033D2CE1D
MFVPVAVVPTVQVPVMHIVHMVVVGYGHVPTALPVFVRVVLVYGVSLGGALVPVIVVDVVQVPVMHIVHMVVVRHGDVTAPLTMFVCVALVRRMCGRHALPRIRFPNDDPKAATTHPFYIASSRIHGDGKNNLLRHIQRNEVDGRCEPSPASMTSIK